MSSTVLHLGDCVEVMRTFEAESFTAILTDPPYGLEFMGKDWDTFRTAERSSRWSGENSGASGGFDVPDTLGFTKPIPSYGGKRATTSRCRTCGKRDAFRNSHACGERADWVQEKVDPYCAPASMLAFQEWTRTWALEAYRVLKPGGMLLAFGGPRMFHRLASGVEDAGFEVRDVIAWLHGQGFPKSMDIARALAVAQGAKGGPATDVELTEDAKPWRGFGTALKPAWEGVLVAMRPLGGTFAANALEHGVAGLNVDGGRIPTNGEVIEPVFAGRKGSRAGPTGKYGDSGDYLSNVSPLGRWPANLALDELAARELDEQSGELHARGNLAPTKRSSAFWGSAGAASEGPIDPGDTGGASRFFYTSKAGDERHAEEPGGSGARTDSIHPTVKPLDLMQWLARLVRMPKGTRILDPFAGSGSTLIAAAREGVECVGIEKERDYAEFARKRFVADAPLFNTCELVEASSIRPGPLL